jgi:hypothetical protein
MTWPDDIIKDRTRLMPPADPAIIETVAAKLGVRFPADFVDFLRFSDGGVLPGGAVLVYSAGTGPHPAETILAANGGRPPEFPLLLIARDAYEEYGFLKSELAQKNDQPCAVYKFYHETEEIERAAPSFADFVRAAIRHTS